MAEDSSVLNLLHEILDGIGDLRTTVASIEERLNSVVTDVGRVEGDMVCMKKTVYGNGDPGISDRLRNLEKIVYGIAGVLGGLISSLVVYIIKYFVDRIP